MVQFFIGGELVKTHPRKARGKQTDFGDYPPEKIAFHMRTPAWCRRQAAGIGPACEQVIAELLADNALYRLRAAQGVIGLADKHDPPGSRRPAPRRSRPGIRPTGPSGASWPPAPNGTSCPPRPGTAARRRSCAARRLRQRHPHARRRITSDAVTPGTAEEHLMTAAAASGNAPLAAHGRLSARRRLIEQSGIPGLALYRRPDEIIIQVPAALADAAARASGGRPARRPHRRTAAPDPRPGGTQGWIRAAGVFAGHQVRIYTAIAKEETP